MRRDHLFGRLSRREPRPVAEAAAPPPPQADKPATAEATPPTPREVPSEVPKEARAA